MRTPRSGDCLATVIDVSTRSVTRLAYDPRMAVTIDRSTPDQQADHPLRMSGRGTFYSFSFDLGPDIDPIDMANTLLKTDMATIAGSPSRGGLRVGKRIRDAGRVQSEAIRYAEWLEIFNSDDIQWLRMFRLHPKITIRILFIGRRYAFRYLLFVLHRILWGVQRGSKSADDPSSEESGDEDESVKKHYDEAYRIVEEASTNLTERLNKRHIYGALRLRLQQKMYFPRYYKADEPFIRVELNQAFYRDQSHNNQPIEVSLMIHRSGVCIVTFAMPIANEISVDDAFAYLLASKRRFEEIELSVPILGFRPRSMNEYYHRWGIAISESDKLEWVRFREPADGKDKITVESVFSLYIDAIERAAGQKMQTEWRCNTTLFLGTPLCGCDGAEAKAAHEAEFAQMMVRSRELMPVTEDVRKELLKNYLVNSDEEIWLSVGHAIHTIWNYDYIDYTRDMETVEPIEAAILQHRQLEAIDHRTVNVSIRDKDLFAAQRQLATGLPEYGRNLMTDLNAPAVVDGMAVKFRTPQLYSRLNDRVKVLESVVNTRFARKQSKRSLAISVIGLGVVLILLLPRIDELLKKLAILSPTASVVKTLRNFMGGEDQTTVAIYIVAIGLAVLVLARLSLPFPNPGRIFSWLRGPKWPKSKRNFGYSTKHDVVVSRGDSDDDEDSDPD